MPAKLIPDKIKKVVEGLPKVFRCEVIAVPDKKYLLRPVIYIQLVPGSIYEDELEKAIKAKCQMELPTYMIPKDIIVIDKFPLKPSLKVDWGKLEEDYNKLIG